MKLADRILEKSPFLLRQFRKINFKGKGRIVSAIDIGKTTTENCGGINFHLDLRDNIQKEIFFNQYEPKYLRLVGSLVSPGNVCVDAGSNVGIYALNMAKKLNQNGIVYAFEPEPFNFENLKRNCSLNDFAGIVKPYMAALTDFDGKTALYRSSTDHSGWHSLTEFKDISESKIEVEAVKLDTFAAKNSVTGIDFIKIDVEANEFELLDGAKDCLRNRIFGYIFIEFNGPRLAQKHRSFSEFIELFSDYAYVPVKINMGLIADIKKKRVNPQEICENFLFAAG